MLSRGGLAVALAHMAMAGELGLAVELAPVLADMSAETAARAGLADRSGGAGHAVLTDMSEQTADPLASAATLFGESTGRVLLTCAPEHAAALERALAGHGLCMLGAVAPARASSEPAPAVRGGLPPPGGGWLRICRDGVVLLEHDAQALRAAFQRRGDHV